MLKGVNEIKNILSINHTHKIEWNGKLLNIIIKWDKIVLSEINQSLMGDLFSYPIYEFDKLILLHTEETISKINCKYKIKFHISKILSHKTINKDSIGFI